MGGGCGNVVNPTGFPSFPWPEPGGKGGGDFLFKAPKGPLFGSPFSPFGFAECTKRGVRNGGSARSLGTAAGTLQGKE